MSNSDAIFRVEKVAAPLRQSVTDSIRNASPRPFQGWRPAARARPVRVDRRQPHDGARGAEPARIRGSGGGRAEPRPLRRPPDAPAGHGRLSGPQRIEGLACQLFVENADEDHRQALSDVFHAPKAAMRRPDPQAPLRTKNQFMPVSARARATRPWETAFACYTRVSRCCAQPRCAPRPHRAEHRRAHRFDGGADGPQRPTRPRAGQRHVRQAGKAALELVLAEEAGILWGVCGRAPRRTSSPARAGISYAGFPKFAGRGLTAHEPPRRSDGCIPVEGQRKAVGLPANRLTQPTAQHPVGQRFLPVPG